MDVVVSILKKERVTNPTILAEVEKIAAEYKGRDRALDAHAERKRIAEQRAVFAALPVLGPNGNDVLRLCQAMIERAWQLLDAGLPDACDALLEFVPEADATAMLDKYFKEDGTA